MADIIDKINDPNAKLSRRNVVVGTAWAVPVVMAVGAAPAMATSNITGATADYVATGTKVNFQVNVSGFVAGSGDTVTLTIAPPPGGAITWNGQSPLPSRLLAGASTSWTGNVKTATAGTYTVTFTVTSGAQTLQYQDTFTI